jgi:hypothetical protein
MWSVRFSPQPSLFQKFLVHTISGGAGAGAGGYIAVTNPRGIAVGQLKGSLILSLKQRATPSTNPTFAEVSAIDGL